MQKLPSGNYRKQIYMGKEDGKRIYESVTAPTIAELKLKEAEVRLRLKATEPSTITFKLARDKLIASKSNVLSPSTLRGYKSILRNFNALDEKKVSSITESDLQNAVNDYAVDHSPKSCASACALAVEIIRSVKDFSPNIKLPQKERYCPKVPTEEDVKTLIISADKELSIAISLAAFGPMRRGEVCALKHKDINKNTVHVHADMVKSDGGYVYKETPKSSAGDRYIQYPAKIIRRIGRGNPEEFIIKTQPHAVYKRFKSLCKRLGMPDYRFHDLRVFGASYLHKTFPTSYIMERGGWDTESVLVEIYRKTLSGEAKRLTDKLNAEIAKNFFT